MEGDKKDIALSVFDEAVAKFYFEKQRSSLLAAMPATYGKNKKQVVLALLSDSLVIHYDGYRWEMNRGEVPAKLCHYIHLSHIDDLICTFWPKDKRTIEIKSSLHDKWQDVFHLEGDDITEFNPILIERYKIIQEEEKKAKIKKLEEELEKVRNK